MKNAKKGFETFVMSFAVMVKAFTELETLQNRLVTQNYQIFIDLGCQYHAIIQWHKDWKNDKTTEKVVLVTIGKDKYDLKKIGQFFTWLRKIGKVKCEYGQANKFVRCYLGRTSFEGISNEDAYLLRLNDVNRASVFASSKLSLTAFKKAMKAKEDTTTERRKHFTLFSDRKGINCGYFQNEETTKGYISEGEAKVAMLNLLVEKLGIQAIRPPVFEEAMKNFAKYKETASLPVVIETKARHARGKGKAAKETLLSLSEVIEGEVIANVEQ